MNEQAETDGLDHRSQSNPPRPPQVTLAVKLILAAIAIGIVQAAMQALRHIEVRSPDLLIISKAIIYAIGFFLVYRVARGDNWARWVLAALLFFAIPLASWPSLQAFAHYPVFGLLELISVALYVFAIVQLFRKDVAEWFSSSK